MEEYWLAAKIALDVDIAESAARLRASLRLKLADAVQAASTLTINAAALVTRDRDFSGVRSPRVISRSPAATAEDGRSAARIRCRGYSVWTNHSAASAAALSTFDLSE
jgi:hypothetical protein